MAHMPTPRAAFPPTKHLLDPAPQPDQQPVDSLDHRAQFLAAPGICANAVGEALSAGIGLIRRFGFKARVGIDRVSPSTSHSKSIVYGIADSLTIMELRSLSTHIRPYLFLPVLGLLKGSVLALLLALFFKLSSKSGAKFFSLLGKFTRIGFLELGKILKFPFYSW